MGKKSDLKNTFDDKYFNKKILFGCIQMKPNVFSLDVHLTELLTLPVVFIHYLKHYCNNSLNTIHE